MKSFHFPDGNKEVPALKIEERVRVFASPSEKYADWPYTQAEFRPLETKAIEAFRQIARDVTEGKKVKIDG